MSNTIVSAAPVVAALSPLVNAAISGLIVGIGGLVFAGLAKMTGIAFTPDYQEMLEKAADFEIEAIIARSEDNLAGGQVRRWQPSCGDDRQDAEPERDGNHRQARSHARRGKSRGRQSDWPRPKGNDRSTLQTR